MPLARRRVTRVELEGARELGLGLPPVPVEPELDEGQRGMALGEAFVELERLERGLARLADGRPDGGRAEADRQQRAAIRQPGVGERVRGSSPTARSKSPCASFKAYPVRLFERYRPRRYS